MLDIENTFDTWNNQKKILHTKISQVYFKEWDVWWCSIGINIGNESYGKWENFRRPILIIKKLSADLFIAIPLTSKNKQWSWFCPYVLHGQTKYAMLYQVRTLHKNRLQRKIWELDETYLFAIKKSLRNLLSL